MKRKRTMNNVATKYMHISTIHILNKPLISPTDIYLSTISPFNFVPIILTNVVITQNTNISTRDDFLLPI